MRALRLFSVLIISLLMCGVSDLALAQSKSEEKSQEKPSISIGAVIFADYTYTLNPTAKDSDGNVYRPSAFNVGRAYLNVTGKYSWIAFRITPDISRETGAGSSLSGSLTFRLKYAFAQANLDKISKGSFVRLGIQQTPYIDYTEGVYGYRFQGPTFVDREGFLSSSDAGVSGRYMFPGNLGDVHVGYYNGENYSKPEVNDEKALQGRVSLRPLGKLVPGLRVAGFYSADAYVRDGERTRIVGNMTFESKYVNVGFEYLAAQDQASTKKTAVEASGYSVWATPKLANGVGALLRYDNLEPDQAIDRSKTRTVVGVAYWFTLKGVASALIVDYERQTLTATPNQERLALHALVNF